MARLLFDSRISLSDALDKLHTDPCTMTRVPLIVRIVENPKFQFFDRNVFLIPGAMHLLDHDAVHILLDKGFAPHEEAYVIGVTMGSTQKISPIIKAMYLAIAQFLYPSLYRFRERDVIWLNVGIRHGQAFGKSDISKIRATEYRDWPIEKLRSEFLSECYIEKYLASRR